MRNLVQSGFAVVLAFLLFSLAPAQLRAGTPRITSFPKPSTDQPIAVKKGQEVAVLAGGCFLGGPGRVSAHPGSAFGHLRLFRRHNGETELRSGQLRKNGPCGERQNRLRSRANYLWADSDDLFFRGAQSHGVGQARAGLGNAVPLGNLLLQRCAEENRRGLHRSAGCRQNLPAENCHPGIALECFLQRGRLPPELSQGSSNNPYIVINDLPKLGELRKQFPDLYRE